ncbi:MAG: hypothetical protein QNJ40_01710 [Xanthomonadales bacterium]|nr:hypothetical protein [Xanthomonadales bacterium]
MSTIRQRALEVQRQRNQARLLAASALLVFVWLSLLDSGKTGILDFVSAGIIVLAGVRPMVVWLSAPDRYGLPIFPLHAVSFVWAYALPILSAHDVVLSYPPAMRFGAALLIFAYLLIGYVVWRMVASRPNHIRGKVFLIGQSMSSPVLYVFLAIGALFQVLTASGSLGFLGSMGSIARAIFSSLFILSVFALSYRWGQGGLKPYARLGFLAGVGLYGLASCSGLFLIQGLLISAAALGGYFFSARKIPWIPILLLSAVFSILHLGKESMRNEYWSMSRSLTVTPAQYPEWYTDWVNRGIERLTQGDDPLTQHSSRSLLERASLLHMLLRTVDLSPQPVDYLYGETYARVPLILVPRVIYANKPPSHEASTILSVNYGLMMRESAVHTTIAWGLVAEAYANFGTLGVLMLAVVIPGLYAGIARWAKGFPIGSARMLMAFLATFMALNAEYTSTVFASVLFQSSVAVVVALLLMRRVDIAPVSLRTAID